MTIIAWESEIAPDYRCSLCKAQTKPDDSHLPMPWVGGLALCQACSRKVLSKFEAL